MIFQEHTHHRASRRILLLHHNISIHHQFKGIIKGHTLHHLQLVTLWITVLNSHHLLKKRRRINGSNSTFHNYSPNCASKWILCIHTWACAHIYIYLIFLFFFFFYTVGVVVCIVAASASPIFLFDECDSSLLKSHLGESMWEINLVCMVSIYVMYYLFHVMWISIISIKYETIMVFFFQINLYFSTCEFYVLSFFVNCVKLICIIKNGIKMLTLIPRQYKWLSRVFDFSF